jgi:hypothetical protein
MKKVYGVWEKHDYYDGGDELKRLFDTKGLAEMYAKHANINDDGDVYEVIEQEVFDNPSLLQNLLKTDGFTKRWVTFTYITITEKMLVERTATEEEIQAKYEKWRDEMIKDYRVESCWDWSDEVE